MTDTQPRHPSETHLDADLLTGFAEGLLLPAECELCLLHLAGCADCRQVAFAAQAGLDPAFAPIFSEEPEFEFEGETAQAPAPYDVAAISAVDAAAAKRAQASLQAADERASSETAHSETLALPLEAKIEPVKAVRTPKAPLWRTWIGSLSLACAAVACAAVAITVSHKQPSDAPTKMAKANMGEAAPARPNPQPPVEDAPAAAPEESTTAARTPPEIPATREPKLSIGSASAAAGGERASSGPRPVRIDPGAPGAAPAPRAVAPVNGIGRGARSEDQAARSAAPAGGFGSTFTHDGGREMAQRAPTAGIAAGFGRSNPGGMRPGDASAGAVGAVGAPAAKQSAADRDTASSHANGAAAPQPAMAAAAPAPPAAPPVLQHAELHGTVTDSRGDAIANANVTLRGADGSPSGTAATDAQGVFLIGSLAPGDYQLAVAAQGFNPLTQRVRVTPGSGATVTPELEASSDPRPVHIVPSGPSTAPGNAPARAMNGAVMAEKPAARVSLGDRTLTLDGAGGVQLQVGSSAERPVAAPWTGHAVRLGLTGGEPRQFQVTLRGGQAWLSADGEHWRQR